MSEWSPRLSSISCLIVLHILFTQDFHHYPHFNARYILYVDVNVDTLQWKSVYVHFVNCASCFSFGVLLSQFLSIARCRSSDKICSRKSVNAVLQSRASTGLVEAFTQTLDVYNPCSYDTRIFLHSKFTSASTIRRRSFTHIQVQPKLSPTSSIYPPMSKASIDRNTRKQSRSNFLSRDLANNHLTKSQPDTRECTVRSSHHVCPLTTMSSFFDKGYKAAATTVTATDVPASAAEESLPWVEKYRPVTLDDVVSHQDLTETCSVCSFVAVNSTLISD